jgi:hypothetical protein
VEQPQTQAFPESLVCVWPLLSTLLALDGPEESRHQISPASLPDPSKEMALLTLAGSQHLSFT